RANVRELDEYRRCTVSSLPDLIQGGVEQIGHVRGVGPHAQASPLVGVASDRGRVECNELKRSGEPVQYRNSSERVIDAGRERTDRNLYQLPHGEFQILGGRPFLADGQAAPNGSKNLIRYPGIGMHYKHVATAQSEMARAQAHVDKYVFSLRELYKTIKFDYLNIATFIHRHGSGLAILPVRENMIAGAIIAGLPQNRA